MDEHGEVGGGGREPGGTREPGGGAREPGGTHEPGGGAREPGGTYEPEGGAREPAGARDVGGLRGPGGPPLRSRGMLDRMKGAAMLDVPTYEEVEADTTATGQAAGVVAIVAVCEAIGTSGEGLVAAAGAAVGALVLWLIWAGVTYVVGDRMFGGTATWGELLRTLGFAHAPGALLILAFIPIVGWLLYPAVWLWMLIAAVIAIRQALDFSTGRALFTAAVGWLVLVVAKAFILVMGAGAALL